MEGREIPEELVPLIEGGCAEYIATANAERVPEATRVRGARVGESRRTVTVFVPSAQAGCTVENLRHDPRIAFFLARVADLRALQIKGEVVAIRPSNEEERELQARHMRAFIDAVASIGGPAKYLERHVFWPSHAIEIRVGELFVQNPGPGAGRRWP
jgi:hypothetical protein